MIDANKTCKIAFIGQTGAGKTSLIHRIIDGEFKATISTIGSADYKKEVDFNGELIKVFLVDTAGQEEYQQCTDFFIRNANVILLCFNPLLEKYEENLHGWRDVAVDHDDNKVILVATQKDKWSDDHPEILQNANKLLQTYRASRFYITSAKTGDGVQSLLSEAINLAFENPIEEPPSIDLTKANEGNSKNCNC